MFPTKKNHDLISRFVIQLLSSEEEKEKEEEILAKLRDFISILLINKNSLYIVAKKRKESSSIPFHQNIV